ncbi:MAG: hypothetical protein KKB31_02355 [Nanoarchaeota archaeon]|nr:hypothetical protein [Nanoarchaeota archaeon]
MSKFIITNVVSSADLEDCVLCHTQTSVLKQTPIQERRFYVEGAGQLCEGCYKETYGK